MQYAPTDLLSYEDIDRDVDRIFRVFCDTSLIEFATNRASSEDYWQNVLEFRRKYVTRFDRPDVPQKAEPPRKTGGRRQANEQLASDETDYDTLEEQPMDVWSARENPADTVGFVFWFDVRADYWDRAGADQKLLDTLVPPAELSALYDEAKRVKDRIHEAQDSGVIEWGANDPRSVLASLAAKIVAATSYSRRG